MKEWLENLGCSSAWPQLEPKLAELNLGTKVAGLKGASAADLGMFSMATSVRVPLATALRKLDSLPMEKF